MGINSASSLRRQGSRFVAELDYRKEAENAIQFADAMAKLNLSSVAVWKVSFSAVCSS